MILFGGLSRVKGSFLTVNYLRQERLPQLIPSRDASQSSTLTEQVRKVL